MLEYLEDYTEKDIPDENIQAVVSTFFTIGDQLMRPEDERMGLFEFGNDLRMARIVRQLIRRLEEAQRFEILWRAITYGDSVAFIVREVTTLAQQHGKYTNQRPTPLEERIVNAASCPNWRRWHSPRSGMPPKIMPSFTSNFERILHSWLNWADEEEVRNWVEICKQIQI